MNIKDKYYVCIHKEQGNLIGEQEATTMKFSKYVWKYIKK
jgi:hypothetical protein